MFEASFFSKQRLFGAYHPAHDITADRLLVICPPLFDEYRRCYRALTELAVGCAAQGTHVFRFDYFGTGESWGLLEEATVSTWLTDVHDAIEEGLALSGATQVYVCGVRFGATLAAQARHPAIVEYILWDLIESGVGFLDHLAEVDRALERSQREIAHWVNVIPEPVQYEMFHLSPALREGLRELRVDLSGLHSRARVHRIVSQEARAVEGVEYSGHPYAWPVEHDGLFLPKAALEAIARRLT
jgi:pimeloyl-ACP methyl ester carboxylesterase